MTEQQQLFCRFFVNNHNATQAARKADYRIKNAGWIGYDLLTILTFNSYALLKNTEIQLERLVTHTLPARRLCVTNSKPKERLVDKTHRLKPI